MGLRQMAGRRPKPAALKLLEGGGKNAIRMDEPQAEPGTPYKPIDDLSPDASEHWDYLASLLESEGRLTKSDGPMLTAASLAYAVGMRLTRIVTNGKDGDQAVPLFIEVEKCDGNDGHAYKTLEKTPVLSEERAQWERYRKCCNDLCLSAGTRARARVGGQTKQNRLQAFLGARPTKLA